MRKKMDFIDYSSFMQRLKKRRKMYSFQVLPCVFSSIFNIEEYNFSSVHGTFKEYM